MNSVDLPPLSSDMFYMYYILLQSCDLAFLPYEHCGLALSSDMIYMYYILLQSCDLAFLPYEQCGLAPTKFRSVLHVLYIITKLRFSIPSL